MEWSSLRDIEWSEDESSPKAGKSEEAISYE
jgi:hypothetical protein